jgi:hypothetical protein
MFIVILSVAVSDTLFLDLFAGDSSQIVVQKSPVLNSSRTVYEHVQKIDRTLSTLEQLDVNKT